MADSAYRTLAAVERVHHGDIDERYDIRAHCVLNECGVGRRLGNGAAHKENQNISLTPFLGNGLKIPDTIPDTAEP